MSEMSKNEEILSGIAQKGIKSEVILDTLLTPVIAELIEGYGLKNNGKNAISGKLKLITKEFPLVKDINKDYTSIKSDYLLADKEYYYLVELKTTSGSTSDSQVDHYSDKIEEGTLFESLWKEFISLFYHVYDKSLSSEDASTQDMEELFKNKTMYYEGDRSVASNDYLQKNNISSSRKYITQAGQLLKWYDSEKADKLKKKVRVIYLVPDGKNDEKIRKGLKGVLAGIVHLKGSSFKMNIEEEKKAYVEWLFDEILNPLFGAEAEIEIMQGCHNE